jgi:hypothetical protein
MEMLPRQTHLPDLNSIESHRLQKLGRPLNPGRLHKWRFPN